MNKRGNDNIRELFIGIDQEFNVNGTMKTFINFDNAATTPPLKASVNSIQSFLAYYGSVGRGCGYKSQVTTKIFEDSKDEILNFFNIKTKENYGVIYVKNTTEGMNLLANKLVFSSDDIILTTRMEHHSNDLPWRFTSSNIKYVEVDKDGRLNINEFEEMFYKYKEKIKLVAVTGASNVTGYVNDIQSISNIVHRNGALMLLDAAQLAPHRRIEMEGLVDFLVFSAHKMYAPFGIGVIVYKKECFSKEQPFIKGGGTVFYVGDEDVIWSEYPEREEGGTPNVLGVIGLVSAMKQIKRIGFDYMEWYEGILAKALIIGLKSITEIKVYSDNNLKNKLAIGTFNINGLDYSRVSQLLDYYGGVAVRSGCFCAHPYIKRLLGISDEYEKNFLKNPNTRKPGMVRASMGLYNSVDEISTFLNVLELIIYREKLYR